MSVAGRDVAWLALRILPFIGLIVLWDAAARSFDVPVLFPTPLATWEKAVHLISEGQLQQDIAISLWRISAGFAVGCALGTVFGLMMGLSRLVADVLGPFVHTLRFIGPIAWILPS